MIDIKLRHWRVELLQLLQQHATCVVSHKDNVT
jgi:hypothetical protein